MPRPPLTEIDARRIAVIKPSALGDIVHALPILPALRHRFPAAHVTWVVNRAYEPLLTGHPGLDATLAFDRGSLKRGVVAGARAALTFAKSLRAGEFDLVLDLQGLFRSGLMTAATRAPRRVGLSTAREGAAHFYTDVVPTPGLDAAHAVDRCWRMAEALGVGHLPKTWHLPIDPAAAKWVDAELAPLPRPWLVFGVGARWLTKRWPPQHFAALARAAQERHGGSVVFIGTADEEPLAVAAAADLSGPVRHLSGRTTMPQVIAVLARADVVVANDTGPLHLAAALGRPVVAPYTCTAVRLHGPYGAERGTAETTVACRASYVRTCPHLSCMAELTPDRLRPKLFEALSAWPTLSRSA
ncbi:MAG: glycosyltransferase family 9 protein [Gemmataceae bacterium]